MQHEQPITFGHEKRRFFRINDNLLFACRKSEPEDDTAAAWDHSSYRILAQKRRLNWPLIRRLRMSHPALSDYLWQLESTLEKKLRYPSQLAPELEPSRQNINLSATGLRFVSDESFEQSSRLKIKLVLPEDGPLLLNGSTVYSHYGTNSHLTAVEFIDQSNTELELLTRHVHKRQWQRLRKEQESSSFH